MGEYSRPLSRGVLPGMLSGKETGVLCVVLLTTEGVCVSVPTKVQEALGPKATEALMDDVAEAACKHLVTKQ